MSLYKKYAFRGLLAGVFIALAAVVGGFATNSKPLVAEGARDCDSNAIIYCGAMSVSELMTKYGQNTTKDLPQIYSAFGISPSKLKTQAAVGQVHKDGTVWLNGVQIGSGAITAGRSYKAGSTAVAGVWARSPSVSFAASSIDAFIGFENGKPAWAILSACGNPVKWNKPNVTIEKTVSKPDLSAWVKDATYVNTSEVRYLLKVGNNGNASDTNVGLIDYLPSYQTYVPGSTKINGVDAGTDALTKNGLNLGTIAPGKVVQVSFRAKLQVPATKCGVTDMVNKARVDSDKTGPKEDTATTHTNIVCAPPKVVKCDALTGPDTLNVGDKADYIAIPSDNTLVSGYTFTVNGQPATATGNKLNFTFATAGTYTIAAKVIPKAGVTDGGSTACVKTVKVKEIVKTPVYSCDLLTATPATLKVGEIVTATGTYTAKDGAVFKSASFNFGEGAPVVVTNPNAVTATHTYTTVGDKKITLEVVFTVGAGTVSSTSSNCEKTVKVYEEQKVVTSCDALSASGTNLTLGQTSNLTATATAMNTTVTSYEFTVNGETVQNTAASTYAFKPTANGTYNVTVKVHFANGDVKGGNGTCAKTITVTETKTPVYSCDLLTLSTTTIKNGDKVTATVKYTANNGATFQKAVVNFGEASVNVASATNGSFTADYTYKTAKDYAVTATITFAAGDKTYDVTSAACASKVTVKPVEKCPISGKEQFEKNDTVNCNEVKGVTTIPDTGAGNMIGLFAAVTTAGAFLHSMWTRRAMNR